MSTFTRPQWSRTVDGSNVPIKEITHLAVIKPVPIVQHIRPLQMNLLEFIHIQNNLLIQNDRINIPLINNLTYKLPFILYHK